MGSTSLLGDRSLSEITPVIATQLLPNVRPENADVLVTTLALDPMGQAINAPVKRADIEVQGRASRFDCAVEQGDGLAHPDIKCVSFSFKDMLGAELGCWQIVRHEHAGVLRRTRTTGFASTNAMLRTSTGVC